MIHPIDRCFSYVIITILVMISLGMGYSGVMDLKNEEVSMGWVQILLAIGVQLQLNQWKMLYNEMCELEERRHICDNIFQSKDYVVDMEWTVTAAAA